MADTDFRALCAELTEFVARLTKHYYEPAELLTRARAALADEPAAPAPPADGEVADLTPEHTSRRTGSDLHPEVREAYRYVDSVVATADFEHPLAWCGWALREAFLAGCTHARAALAEEPAAPAPPADGEVAELVEFLRIYGDHVLDEYGDLGEHDQLTRTAELLQRQALVPVPVPVSERLPGPGDCDEQGRCWWGDAGNDEFVPSWRLIEQPDKPCFDHWLPHWALPVREAK